MSIENEEPYEILQMVKQFFLYSQKELEKFDNPYTGTNFELVPFEQCFPLETTRMIDTKSSDYSTNRHFEIKCKNLNWYALDSFHRCSNDFQYKVIYAVSKTSLTDKFILHSHKAHDQDSVL